MKKLLAIAILAVMLCLAGLVMSGEAQARRVLDEQTIGSSTLDVELRNSLNYCAIHVRSPRRRHPRPSPTIKRGTRKPSPSRHGDSHPRRGCLDGLGFLVPSSRGRNESPVTTWF